METEKSINENEEQTELFIIQEQADYYLKEIFGQLLVFIRCAYETSEEINLMFDDEYWQGMDKESQTLIERTIEACIFFAGKVNLAWERKDE